MSSLGLRSLDCCVLFFCAVVLSLVIFDFKFLLYSGAFYSVFLVLSISCSSRSSSVLSYSFPFCQVLLASILFHAVMLYFLLFCSFLSSSVFSFFLSWPSSFLISCSILFCSILSCTVLLYYILLCFISFSAILFNSFLLLCSSFRFFLSFTDQKV